MLARQNSVVLHACLFLFLGLHVAEAVLTLTVNFLEYQNPRGTLYNGAALCGGDGDCRIALHYCLEHLSCATGDVDKCSNEFYKFPTNANAWSGGNFLKLWSLTSPLQGRMDFKSMQGYRLKIKMLHYSSLTSSWPDKWVVDTFLIDIPANNSITNSSLCGRRASQNVDGTSLKLTTSWHDDNQPLVAEDRCVAQARSKRAAFPELLRDTHGAKRGAAPVAVQPSRELRLCWQNACGDHGVCVEERKAGFVAEKCFCENGWFGDDCGSRIAA